METTYAQILMLGLFFRNLHCLSYKRPHCNARVTRMEETENSRLSLTGISLFAEFMRNPCVDAGLIPPLVQMLNCKDQEVLLQTGRALGNICYDSRKC